MQIAQDLLDRYTTAIMSNDADGFAATIIMPLAIRTPEIVEFVNRAADIRPQLDALRASLTAAGVDNFIPVAKTVAYLSPEMINCIYETHLLRGVERIMAPYQSSMTIVKHETGGWRIAALAHAIDRVEWAGTRSGAIQSFAVSA